MEFVNPNAAMVLFRFRMAMGNASPARFVACNHRRAEERFAETMI
jgi:hypothetical protein